MPLFGRRPAMGPLPHIAGIAELAAARGWTPAGDHPFGGELDLPIHRVSRVMYGAPAREPSYTASGGAAPTFYADAYRLAVDGRDVVIANAWTPMRTALSTLAHQRHGTAVCAVELPTVLMITAIESRRFRAAIPLRSVSTGDPAFDAMFRVTGVPGEGAHTLTPAARRLIMARDDWEFCAQRYLFCCVGLGPFESAQDVLRRVDEVLGIVAAFPTDTVPATVDHSADALIDRFSRIDTLEEGMAALTALSEADRRLLAQSTSPLAALADVRTPQEAVARVMAMDTGRRAQLLAMFMRVDDERHGRF